MPRLKDTYKAELVPAMMQKFEYKNVNQVPKLEKVAVSYTHLDVYKRQLLQTCRV